MAKNNFKAKEATDSADFAHGIGTTGAAASAAGLDQQAQGFGSLKDTLGQQKSFADMLQSAAAGTGGPTMADQEVKDVTARNNANAAGFAAGAKGLNPALAARQALMAQAGNNQQEAGQAAQTRVQEQLAARSQLGGALAGEAATAGGMTSAGQGLYGTGGQLANQSNSNLIQSRQGANQINADVAKQNAGAINGAISGVMNAAGGAFGLAEGGVVPGEPPGTQSDETSIALAKGGLVPAAPHIPTTVEHAPAPRRSFAAQVAHHLAREYFAEGGEVTHEPYSFQPMDLRTAKGKPKHGMGEGLDLSPTKPIQENEQGEGYDSEGKKKSLKLSEGGEVEPEEDDEDPQAPEQDQGESDEEYAEHFFAEGGEAGADDDSQLTNFELRQRERDRAREAHKEKDTEVAMGDLEKVSKSKEQNLAEGGEADNESAGLDMRRAQPSEPHPDVAQHPSAFARMGAALQGAAAGFDGGNGSAVPKMVSAGPSVSQKQAAGPAGPAGPPRLSLRTPVREPGGAVAPLMGDKSGAPFTARLKFDAGGSVPGKAPVDGNSLKNDVVDAKLSPGEVVLPRTISHDPKKAKKFVELLQDGHSGHSALAHIKGKR